MHLGMQAVVIRLSSNRDALSCPLTSDTNIEGLTDQPANTRMNFKGVSIHTSGNEDGFGKTVAQGYFIRMFC